MKHRFFDKTLVIYTMIAVFCWCIGTALMFLLYNCLHVGYWISSACNYLVGGTLSYLLNRKYTFHNNDNRVLVLAKYIVHMLVCYAVSYSLAPLITRFLLDHWTLHARGNLSLGVGSVTFTILNYLGQRYVVFHSFRPKNSKKS